MQLLYELPLGTPIPMTEMENIRAISVFPNGKWYAVLDCYETNIGSEITRTELNESIAFHEKNEIMRQIAQNKDIGLLVEHFFIFTEAELQYLFRHLIFDL